MIPVRACLICGTPHLDLAAARIAPFIAERCGLGAPLPPVRAARCPSCDFVFFDHRFDEEEARKLYAGYRDASYNRQRLRHEPYYHVLRELFEEGREATRKARIQDLANLFEGISRPFPKVLDYGGERDGWLAKGVFPRSSVTSYDLSFDAAPPAPRSQDLVLCSNVLEHVSFPLDLLGALKACVKPSGLICLEVPLEHWPGLRDFHARGEALLHEHVSFYSPRSVFRLLARAGLRPLGRGILRGGTLGILARPSRLGRWPRLLDLFAPRVPEPLPSLSAPGVDPMINGTVVRRVNALVDQWNAEGRTLVVAPAGRFSRGLLEHTRLGEANILGFCDRDPRAAGTALGGIPVRPYGELEALGPDFILVASPEHEPALCQALSGQADQGRPVLPLSKLIWP
ncbi:class I SAM-dependent methyltransferase [Mesoterricola silvestris]|uniref:Methyltransferase family protein n=1 Tax=Mesoterricola silvestris TaxID=2927979 RepID=A0AA48K7E4_9BACT|nr:class I SAM-dependent methyltransferase [Mesoterricola silvestris]BDU71016.1 hypothetical protein METEAL_01900 [Mesoterricola silvestris]